VDDGRGAMQLLVVGFDLVQVYVYLRRQIHS
jgi:hypothetical protein